MKRTKTPTKSEIVKRLKELGTEIVCWETDGYPSPRGVWQIVNLKLIIRVDTKEAMELLDLLCEEEI